MSAPYVKLEAGMQHIVNDPIVSRGRVMFSPLEIKLSLMTQFVRSLDTNDESFKHIIFAHPASSSEIKASVFHGLQIRALLRDQCFVRKINEKEKGAWLSFEVVMENIFGNVKAENYETLIASSLVVSFPCLQMQHECQTPLPMQSS